MKNNIYKKLHNACINAGGVKKAEKVRGMHFNPLLHDAVQETATQALLDQGLYPTCSYKTELNEKFVLVTCTMTIHDVENPETSVLNLKTGIQDDDGYSAKPFKQNSTGTTVGSMPNNGVANNNRQVSR
jgi:hypothetical protein